MLGLACLVASMVLTGCASVLQGAPSDDGGNGGPAPYDHATGAEDVLVSIDVAGGFLPMEVSLRDTADFLLVGDATTVTPGAMIEIYPGPALYPLQSAKLTESQIQELFRSADDAGLLDGEIDYGEPPIADAPHTIVHITVDGRTVTQSVYALGLEDDGSPGLSDAQRAARTALQGFIDTAQGMAGAADEGYLPTGVVAHRLNMDLTTPVDDPGLEQPPQTWPITTVPPLPTGSDVSSCIAVTGPEVPTLLAALDQANELTPWLIGSDPPARMAFRPLLPGDPGCT